MQFLKTTYCIILLLGTSFATEAKEVFRLELNQRATDDHFRKTQAIIPVFKYTGQPFEGISDFGLKTSKNHKPETFEIKFPDMKGMKDTFYTFLFFGGNTQNTPLGYVFCLIGNNSRMDGNTYLWIDRNMNLDLSDDGVPDTFSNGLDYYHEIKLHHPVVKHAYHVIRLSRFEFQKSLQYKKLVDEHYHKNSGNKKFAGADYSFREQRLNILSADFKHGNDSFRIAMKDVNCNGLYNDKEFDQILIGDYGAEELGDFIFEHEKKSVSFERNFKKYILTQIDPAGRFIEFYHDSEAALSRQLAYCKKIPKFDVVFADDELKPKKIRKFRRKPVYIVFWNLDSPTLEEDTTALGIIYREFGDQIHVIALNYGDPQRKVLGWAHRNKIGFTVGIASQKLLNTYFVESMPASFLTNRRQRLCKINITSQELLTHLRTNYSKN